VGKKERKRSAGRGVGDVLVICAGAAGDACSLSGRHAKKRPVVSVPSWGGVAAKGACGNMGLLASAQTEWSSTNICILLAGIRLRQSCATAGLFQATESRYEAIARIGRS
jgi:hypothetical protein